MLTSRPLANVPTGERWEIHGIVLTNGSTPVHDFLEKLQRKHRDTAAEFFATFRVLLRNAQRDGDFWRPQGSSFKAYGGIWQVRASDHRIQGFRAGNVLVLTNGFEKKKQETPPEETSRCEELKQQFLAAQQH